MTTIDTHRTPGHPGCFLTDVDGDTAAVAVSRSRDDSTLDATGAEADAVTAVSVSDADVAAELVTDA